MTPDEFRDARERLGLSVNKLAQALGVKPRSVWRWQSGDQAVPGPVAALMRLMLRQCIGRDA